MRGGFVKFCSGCKRVYEDNDTQCVDCRKKLKNVKDINEPVRLCVTGGTQRALICGTLKDADIPFVEQAITPMGVSNDIVTGYDVKLSNVAIVVPFSAMPKAYEILVEIGAVDDTMSELISSISEEVESFKAKEEADDTEPMSKAKRATVKIITAVVFLLLIAAAVFGTDYIMQLIKNLFGG